MPYVAADASNISTPCRRSPGRGEVAVYQRSILSGALRERTLYARYPEGHVSELLTFDESLIRGL